MKREGYTKCEGPIDLMPRKSRLALAHLSEDRRGRQKEEILKFRKSPEVTERTLPVMSGVSKSQPQVDQFFTGAEARSDRWRTLLQQSRQWESAVAKETAKAKSHQSQVLEAFEELLQWEDYFAYPGSKLLAAVREQINSGDAAGTTRLVRAISAALVTHSYRSNVEDWESEEEDRSRKSGRSPTA